MGRLTPHVDPFIGVDGGGNCLCGPYLPLSIVRLGPDTVPPQPTNGYDSNRPIIHFSHTHVSGTGGGSRYGNIGVKPFIGIPRLDVEPYEREAEHAEAGYYAVTLRPAGVAVELTSTPRVGVHRYRFPGGTLANIMIDLGAAIQTAGQSPGGVSVGSVREGVEATGSSTGGFVEFVSDREVIGRADLRGGWGNNSPYSVHFYAIYDRPAQQRRVANHAGWGLSPIIDGPNCRAVACFGAEAEVGLRVGISYVSIAQARASVLREANGGSFDAIRARATETWEGALSRLRVEGGTADQRKLFYSLFSRLLCMPSDLGVDDENPLWHSGVRHFTDYYCLWDSVRNANSLIGLFAPELEVDLLNCLLDVADHTWWLPDAWIAGHSAFIQGGSSADILLCEAALKGLVGIDYGKALRQMRKNGEVESPDPLLYGRYLKDYRTLGYLSTNVRRNCVSRHLEYTYQDWCIGALAEHLGDEATAQSYFESSRKIWNLWRDDLHCFAPRNAAGEWVEPFDPARCFPDSHLDPYFYEGTSWQWSFSAHHDFAGLVARHGGPRGFVEHLDRFFGGGHYHSKETMLHVPYLYTYAGRPDRTAERVRECLGRYFDTSRRGIHDNEDMGCQSAFYMCSTIGLYPIMGQDLYLLTTPAFVRTEVELGASGKMLAISAPQADSARPYITSATLNGVPLDRAWLRHREIVQGGVLELQVSDQPNGWGSVGVPPSPLSRTPRATDG